MSDSDDDYEYDSYDEGAGGGSSGDEDGGMKEKNNGGQTDGASASPGAPASDNSQKKMALASCADGEVRLLHMSDIVGPMKSKVAQISDLLDLPAAGAAALLRYHGWSNEKLTDRFWADSEKELAAAGINVWEKSSELSTVGTAELVAQNKRVRGASFGAGAQEGAQEGAEGSGLQSPVSSGVALGLPSGYCGIATCTRSDRKEPSSECRICYCDIEPDEEAQASPCGHFFHDDCYRAYLSTKLGEGPAVVFTTCPEHKCSCLVPPEMWISLLGEPSVGSATLGAQAEDAAAAGGGGGGGGGSGSSAGGGVCEEAASGALLLQKYSRVILEQFVSSNKQMRWCSAPGCERIIMAGAGVSNVRCGPGGCGNAFCFKCGEEAHQPSTCEELITWTEKCQNESETANWILANTKRCPKCTTRIEKNQGCNHMSCSQCKYEFCWMCMGNWAEHGSNTGGYYKCNKFDPAVSTDPDDAAGRAKRELDRYLHYFKRYQAHHSAQLFAEKQLLQTEKRMGELQESTGGSSWIDVQFLKTANEMVIECRRTLKFTYVFGFYLTSPKSMDVEGMAKHRDLFENMQEDLERYTELVSELTEMPTEKMTLPENKESIINNTRVVEKFLDNLIKGCDEGLDEVGKDFSLGAEEKGVASATAAAEKD